MTLLKGQERWESILDAQVNSPNIGSPPVGATKNRSLASGAPESQWSVSESTDVAVGVTATRVTPSSAVGKAERHLHIATQQETPKLSTAHAIAKRVFDVVVAVATLVIMLPIIVGIAIAIRASGSPVFFAHERVGKDRSFFNCYKFRTMIPDAEAVLQELLRSNPEKLQEWRENHKLKDDPRITPFGSFLRKSSLDELPQLWNVIKGDMSLVGPRPIVADELTRFGSKANIYCAAKPGMTGLWQIMGRSAVTYSRRVSMDVLYVQNQSLVLDIWIMFRTIFVVVQRVGAH